MKLKELNENEETLATELEFSKISTELGNHINKYQADAKEVNLKVVKLQVKKANEVLDLMKKTLDGDESIFTIDQKVDKFSKQLLILKKRFIDLREKFKDNEFEKEIMVEVDEILRKIIERITDTTDGAEGIIQQKMKKIAHDVAPTQTTK